MPRELTFFVPSNRKRRNGAPNHMDGTNETDNASRVNKFYAAKRKRENMQWVAEYAAAAAAAQKWKCPHHHKVNVSLVWHEVNKVRDPDNISGGIKYVMDALGTPSRWSDARQCFTRNQYGCGVIVDDSQKFVKKITHDYVTDKEHPGVQVTIKVVDDAQE